MKSSHGRVSQYFYVIRKFGTRDAGPNIRFQRVCKLFLKLQYNLDANKVTGLLCNFSKHLWWATKIILKNNFTLSPLTKGKH